MRARRATYYVIYASIKKISRQKMVEEDYALYERFHYLQLGLEAAWAPPQKAAPNPA